MTPAAGPPRQKENARTTTRSDKWAWTTSGVSLPRTWHENRRNRHANRELTWPAVDHVVESVGSMCEKLATLHSRCHTSLYGNNSSGQSRLSTWTGSLKLAAYTYTFGIHRSQSGIGHGAIPFVPQSVHAFHFTNDLPDVHADAWATKGWRIRKVQLLRGTTFVSARRLTAKFYKFVLPRELRGYDWVLSFDNSWHVDLEAIANFASTHASSVLVLQDWSHWISRGNQTGPDDPVRSSGYEQFALPVRSSGYEQFALESHGMLRHRPGYIGAAATANSWAWRQKMSTLYHWLPHSSSSSSNGSRFFEAYFDLSFILLHTSHPMWPEAQRVFAAVFEECRRIERDQFLLPYFLWRHPQVQSYAAIVSNERLSRELCRCYAEDHTVTAPPVPVPVDQAEGPAPGFECIPGVNYKSACVPGACPVRLLQQHQTLGHCQAKCAQIATCKAVVFNRYGKCYLKSSLLPVSHESMHDHGTVGCRRAGLDRQDNNDTHAMTIRTVRGVGFPMMDPVDLDRNLPVFPSPMAATSSESTVATALAAADAPSKPAFDMLTILRTPTCINYRTVTQAARFLPAKGLRRIWVVSPPRWVKPLSRWHRRVHAVSEEEAVEGVSREATEAVLTRYGFRDAVGVGNTSQRFRGRATAGWYLIQLINLGFVLRTDVLDTLLVHDADQMLLPDFEVFASGFFIHDGMERHKFAVKVGGIVDHSYDHAYACLTGGNMLYHGADEMEARRKAASQVASERDGDGRLWYRMPHGPRGGSFVTHSYVVFKPFMRELLTLFAGGKESAKLRETRLPLHAALRAEHDRSMAAAHETVPSQGLHEGLRAWMIHMSRQRLIDGAPLWMINALRCINPAVPHMGFSEISSYVSHVIAHHPEAVQIELGQSWARNPPASLWESTRATSGHCCDLDRILNKASRNGLQYLGLELGHRHAVPGYPAVEACTRDYTMRSEFFEASPYPPASDPFWTSRGVTFPE
jgi:hypothetical protein